MCQVITVFVTDFVLIVEQEVSGGRERRRHYVGNGCCIANVGGLFLSDS